MPKRSVPKTTILHVLMNAELPERHVTALGEFVDNALGEGSGNATQVIIRYDPKRIEIIDNGDGVARPQALFTLGDSESRLHSRDIGQFGYGSKVGTLYLAWRIRLDTVHDGRQHRHEVDWKRVLDSGEWPFEYDANGYPTSAPSGTTITLSARHESRVWQAEPLAEFLSHIYRPALLAGKKIKLQYRRACSGPFREIDLAKKYVGKLVQSDRLNIKGEAAGKEFNLRAGVVRDLSARLNGVHIAFGHRFIRTENRLVRRHIPPSLYVEVILSPDWKRALAANKSSIAHGNEQLLAEVERLLTPLLDKLEEKETELHIKSIEIRLSRAVNEIISAASKNSGQSGIRERLVRILPDGPPKPPRPNPAPPAPFDEAHGKGDRESKPARNPQTGVKVVFQRGMGERVSKVDVNSTDTRVSLNLDLHFIKGAQQNTECLLVTVFNALLDECVADKRVAGELFPPFVASLAGGPFDNIAKQRMLHTLFKDHEPTAVRH